MNVENVKKMYPKGTEIVLKKMHGEERMPAGLKGTVFCVDDTGQLHIRWENGCSLVVVPEVDNFEATLPSNKIAAILVKPNKSPEIIELEDSLPVLQSLVEGYIEEFTPFEDEVAIICNEEGKINGLPLNRAIYSEPKAVQMTYSQMKLFFQQTEKEKKHATGFIVFTEDSFDKSYTEEERTYVVSSDNKAFVEGVGGYSIYASSLDGKDKCVRLEAYMADERGGKDGWKVEKCYVKSENSRRVLDIIAGDFLILYAPFEAEGFRNMPFNLADKYLKLFSRPEQFVVTEKGIEIRPINEN